MFGSTVRARHRGGTRQQLPAELLEKQITLRLVADPARTDQVLGVIGPSRRPGHDVFERWAERKSLAFLLTGQEVDQAGEHGGEWSLNLPYREPGSTELRRFRAALKAKREDEDGWRWVVLREEPK